MKPFYILRLDSHPGCARYAINSEHEFMQSTSGLYLCTSTRLVELQEAVVEGTASPNELDALKMESDTWALLQALMS